MTRKGMEDPASSEFATGLDMFRPVMASGMAYVWISSDGNTRVDQLNAGRSWVRLNIKGAAYARDERPVDPGAKPGGMSRRDPGPATRFTGRIPFLLAVRRRRLPPSDLTRGLGSRRNPP